MHRISTVILFVLICSLVTAQAPDVSKVPGVVVAHSPASSGKYIGSPSLAVLPNGDYLASHDFFGPSSNEHVKADSRIYRSTNRGKSWKFVTEIHGAFWSKLFVSEGKLYFIGTDRHHGHTIIRTSADNGTTWTEPVDNKTGLLLEGEYHNAPVPVIEHNRRLWKGMESAMGPIKQWGKRYGAFMMSIPVGQDPLVADNWTFSNTLYYDSTYLEGNFGGWLEGNAVVSPEGKILDILRVDDRSTLEEKAAFISISDDGKVATFDEATGFVPFPGGSKKFAIRFDPESQLYWTIANDVPAEVKAANQGKNPASLRNTQALFSSENLHDWTLRKVLLQHEDPVNHGFQYVDWQFDGKDIIFLSRTAYDDGQGGAHRSHDANFLTFHRIKKFRKK
ncbi:MULTISPECIES: sialidase family protein [unclassified Imperialibacter]|uniref:sialidase family protein n=1 Tax=unclassified Imperialibacter TaxID=2629706 RepID=UPI001254329E|nr:MULTISPECIES: sialidase family protein [unclassified Imperialibacter]CAD5290600.1 Periplasmic protein [Imperialibacter sp. 89]CAD5290870.1 Periplasmic protein [Imperialibacter sp. 75]VVT34446.1 Periplasmic protein [Imperialibacter sp. EC-SDR9]